LRTLRGRHQFFTEQINLFLHGNISGGQAGNHFYGMQDGGVIPVELLADIAQGIFGMLAAEIHGHLPGKGQYFFS
jgi:hypothetical protein